MTNLIYADQQINVDNATIDAEFKVLIVDHDMSEYPSSPLRIPISKVRELSDFPEICIG